MMFRICIHVGCIVPLDLRIRRILLPAYRSVSIISKGQNKSTTASGRHTSNHLDLRNTVRVSEDDTDLRWSGALLRKLADLVDDLLGGGLERYVFAYSNPSGARLENISTYLNLDPERELSCTSSLTFQLKASMNPKAAPCLLILLTLMHAE